MERQTSKFNIAKLLRQSYCYRHSRLSGLLGDSPEARILLRSSERCRTCLPDRQASRHDRLFISEVSGNEKGIALAMVLILSVIALTIMAALIYMLTSSTQISGMQKRYKTAFEAGVGGADVAFQLIQLRGDPGIGGINFSWSAALPDGTTDPCLIAKLNRSTSAANWAACADYDQASSISIDPTDPDTYDTTFQLGTAPLQYTVYSKIVNTVEGNSGGEEGLIKSGVVASNSGEVAVVSVPYLYTMEISAENTGNTAERAKLSVLYQY